VYGQSFQEENEQFLLGGEEEGKKAQDAILLRDRGIVRELTVFP